MEDEESFVFVFHEVMKNSKKICKHLHLPLQSGSSRILKLMNRRYTKEQYLDLVDRIRAKVPDVSLTTDIIVGFPGETEEDFLETMDVVRKVRYDSAFTFQYSRRTGTPAAAMEDQIPVDVVKDRFDRLLAEVQEISREVTARHTHTVQEVMMDLYPEIYSCVGCNACTKGCPQSLNVMQYIAYAQRGDFKKCAEESFDCIGCGICASRCPAGISHPMVGELARRLNGKYIAPKSEHVKNRVAEIKEGKFDDLIEQVMQKPIEEMQELYNNREIEK